MAIYHHVPGKDTILDGIVDLVFAEIDLPPATDTDWRDGHPDPLPSARAVLAPASLGATAHGVPHLTRTGDAAPPRRGARLPAPRRALVERSPRTPTPILDSFLYGFALQEANLPFDDEEQVGELAESIIEPFSPSTTTRTWSPSPPSTCCSPATTSATPSSSASTCCSTASPSLPRTLPTNAEPDSIDRCTSRSSRPRQALAVLPPAR